MGTPPSIGGIQKQLWMFGSLFAHLFKHLIRLKEISIFFVGSLLWGPAHYSTLNTCGYYLPYKSYGDILTRLVRTTSSDAEEEEEEEKRLFGYLFVIRQDIFFLGVSPTPL